MKVYPRGCGAADDVIKAVVNIVGLSPRVRGSLSCYWVRNRVSGSIPAGAGQPGTTIKAGMEKSVYPRGCGAAIEGMIFLTMRCGLSPRVRGSQWRRWLGLPFRRSIPAGAGQPTAQEHTKLGSTGLSPRVRGSLHRPGQYRHRRRSIPAGAGQPGTQSSLRSK